MSRLLFLALVVFAVYWLLRSYRRQLFKEDDVAPPVEDMVRCAQCGVHLPKRESVLSEGKYFCGEEHRRLYAESQNKT
ncbi:MAG: PP0621 family protein [Gallionellaceae bacterium]